MSARFIPGGHLAQRHWGKVGDRGGLVCSELPRLILAYVLRLRKRLSVSESSHTESDSSPPLTVRRRCSGLLDVPRFSDGPEDANGTPRKQQEAVGLLTPSGEGPSGRLKLEEELLGSGSSPGGSQGLPWPECGDTGRWGQRRGAELVSLLTWAHSRGDSRRPWKPTAD